MKLQSEIEKIDSSVIKKKLIDSNLVNRIHVYGIIDSTNEQAWNLWERGEGEGTLVIAEHQTAGRGRFGRNWFCPKSKGILMSLILEPSYSLNNTASTTIAASLAVADAISEITGIQSHIKWPNDVVINDKKVCGILTETFMTAGVRRKKEAVVVGIGINVNQRTEDFPVDMHDYATSLYLESEKEWHRSDIIISTLKAFEIYYTWMKEGKFSNIINEVKKVSYILGKRITVISGFSKFIGIAFDFDEEGNLILRLDSGVLKKISAGEVINLRSIE